jgi:hypothetical protein
LVLVVLEGGPSPLRFSCKNRRNKDLGVVFGFQGALTAKPGGCRAGGVFPVSIVVVVSRGWPPLAKNGRKQVPRDARNDNQKSKSE